MRKSEVIIADQRQKMYETAPTMSGKSWAYSTPGSTAREARSGRNSKKYVNIKLTSDLQHIFVQICKSFLLY